MTASQDPLLNLISPAANPSEPERLWQYIASATLPPCLSHATDIITSATLPPWLTYEIHAQIPDEGWGWGGWGMGGTEMAAANVATCDCHFIITCKTYPQGWPGTSLGASLTGPHWPYESTRDGLAARANGGHNWYRSRKCIRLVHKFIVKSTITTQMIRTTRRTYGYPQNVFFCHRL